MKAALEGAKYILMERFAEDANLLEKLRNYLENRKLQPSYRLLQRGRRRQVP